MAVNGVYPFPVTELQPGEAKEMTLTLSLTFIVAYMVASANNSADVWVEDILIGERSLLPPSARGEGIPLELFYATSSVRVTWGNAEVPLCVPIRLKVRNVSDTPKTVRISVMGETRKGDC